MKQWNPHNPKGFVSKLQLISFLHSDNVTDKPIISGIELTPGIHMYDSMDIENSKGLEKEYKRFWNEKATTLV